MDARSAAKRRNEYCTVDIDFSKQCGTPNSRAFRSIRRKVYLALGLKSFVDRRQDICKDKESNLGSVAGY